MSLPLGRLNARPFSHFCLDVDIGNCRSCEHFKSNTRGGAAREFVYQRRNVVIIASVDA